MNEKTEELLAALRQLHTELRDDTRERFKRINPFCEDLFEWRERGGYWTGDDRGVTIYNSTTVVGDVEIGEQTWIGPYCSLDGTAGLSIGKHCSISLGCQLLTHDTVKQSLSGGKAAAEYAPTKIGDCCFLGSYVVVLKGVTIGDHCVVGASSVVTRDVPSHAIVVGAPARRIGTVHIEDDGEVSLVYREAAGGEEQGPRDG